MKTKLLKKIRKRFTIYKDGSWFKVEDFEHNFFTQFYPSSQSNKYSDCLDWIFEHYYTKETVVRRRIRINKTNL